jgi:hypothetical protein
LEKTGSVDESIGTLGLSRSSESMDSRRKSIDGISVVEGLSTEGLEEDLCGIKGGTVVDVGIRLDNPDEFLAWVVEVKLDLVGGRSDRLVTSELNLFNEVLMGVLCHLASLVSVEEDVVNVEGSSNKGLLVSLGNRDGTSGGGSEGLHSPEALTNGAEINVELDLVILYESRLPPLSGYLSAFLHCSTISCKNISRGLDFILIHHCV